MRKVLCTSGETMAFKLGDEEGFRWVGAYEISADDFGMERKESRQKQSRNEERNSSMNCLQTEMQSQSGNWMKRQNHRESPREPCVKPEAG